MRSFYEISDGHFINRDNITSVQAEINGNDLPVVKIRFTFGEPLEVFHYDTLEQAQSVAAEIAV